MRIRITGDNPGVCVQGAEHSRQVNDLESERNSWSSALYGLVAALCLAIFCALILLYKYVIYLDIQIHSSDQIKV